jgi:hypothetical protein
VDQDGRLDVSRCLPYPTGCTTCDCAKTSLGKFYQASCPAFGFPPCMCRDASGAIIDGGSATLNVICDGA